MKQEQRKYAMFRVKEIKRKLVDDIKKEYYVPAHYLSLHEKYSLVKNGLVKLIPFNEMYYDYTDFRDAFDWSSYERKEGFKDEEEMNGRLDAIELEASKIEDQIMLGDSAGALKLLNEFMEKKF